MVSVGTDGIKISTKQGNESSAGTKVQNKRKYFKKSEGKMTWPIAVMLLIFLAIASLGEWLDERLERKHRRELIERIINLAEKGEISWRKTREYWCGDGHYWICFEGWYRQMKMKFIYDATKKKVVKTLGLDVEDTPWPLYPYIGQKWRFWNILKRIAKDAVGENKYPKRKKKGKYESERCREFREASEIFQK